MGGAAHARKADTGRCGTEAQASVPARLSTACCSSGPQCVSESKPTRATVTFSPPWVCANSRARNSVRCGPSWVGATVGRGRKFSSTARSSPYGANTSMQLTTITRRTSASVAAQKRLKHPRVASSSHAASPPAPVSPTPVKAVQFVSSTICSHP